MTVEAPQRTAWRGRDAVIAVVVGFLTSGFAYAVVAPDPTVLELAAFVFPAQWAATLAALLVIARRRVDWRTALRLRAAPRDLWGLLQGATLQIALSSIAYLVIVVILDGEAPVQEVIDTAASAIGPAERISIFLGIGVIGPMVEELVFRGVLLRALEAKGRRRAIFVSAAVFALIHLLDPRAIVAVPFFFVLGVVLARRTLATDRLGAAFAIHAGFNILTVVVLFAVP